MIIVRVDSRGVDYKDYFNWINYTSYRTFSLTLSNDIFSKRLHLAIL